MFNILPKEQKDAIRGEYRTNYIIIFESGFLTLLLASIVFLFSIFLITSADSTRYEKELAFLEEEITTEASSAKEILDEFERRIGILQREGINTSVTDAIDIVERNTQSGIIISSFSYSFEKDKEENVSGNVLLSIIGIAEDRDAMVIFVRSLQSDPQIDTAGAPVSSLAQESNIAFKLELTIKEKKDK